MQKKYYESYIIIDGNLEDDQIEEVTKKYESFLKKNDAEILNEDKMGRRRLAYKIKKRQNGYYVCFEYLANPNVISKLERNLNIDDNIIRYLTIFLDKRTLQEKQDYMKKRALRIAQREKMAEEQNADQVDSSNKKQGEVVSSEVNKDLAREQSFQ